MSARLHVMRKALSNRRVRPLLLAIALVVVFAMTVPRFVEPSGPDIQRLANGKLTDAQAQTLDMTKQLNAYLISTTTLMFGALGWYLSQYRPAASALVRTVFFSTVGFLALAFWYAGQAYAELTAELAQNALGVTPGASRVLYWVELEFAACATAGILVLLVFADAVTRPKP